ncbi:MAG: lysophospholipid acyltransferase family protein, partial [Candidatus Aminicenantes bacterium]|nr:lysophospholipid acyltransferase family protein [Candidatus Aminicenantes bacterium]
MNVMRLLRNVAAYLLAFLLVVVLFVPVLIVSGLCRYDKFLYALSRAVMKIVLRIVGVRIRVHGAAGIDFSQPMVMVCNHLSNLDGPLLYSALPSDPRVLIKSEARKIPLIGLVLKLAGFVFVDRKNPRRRQEALNAAVELIKKKGCSFLVFPEGTRSRSGQTQDFKKGGFMIALKAGVPVLPVKISGSHQLMPPGRIAIRAGTVDIECFPL